MPSEVMNESAALVAKIESLATRELTPCASGSMVWRIWGHGPPLVLLHGASGSWTHWIKNIQPLARHFRVLAPDLPGFGDSDMPPEPNTAQAIAGLVALGLDVLVSPSAQVDIAGFSFGGIIGGLVAARLAWRVRTIVLLGSGGLAFGRAEMPPLRRVDSTMNADEIRSAHRENLRLLMIAQPEAIDDLAVYLQMENVRRARFRSGSIPSSDVLLQALPAIRARITGIWGRDDAFAASHIEDRRHVLAAVQQDLDFRVIEGAGHWVTYEASDEVNAALLDMLLSSSAVRNAMRNSDS
jgi:2-hydroxy-6-oxonona-2,4-dienedioate hydrolase